MAFSNLSGKAENRLENSVIYKSKYRALALREASNVIARNNILAYSQGHAVSVEGTESFGSLIEGNLIAGCAMNSQTESDLWPAGIAASNWNNTFR